MSRKKRLRLVTLLHGLDLDTQRALRPNPILNGLQQQLQLVLLIYFSVVCQVYLDNAKLERFARRGILRTLPPLLLLLPNLLHCNEISRFGLVFGCRLLSFLKHCLNLQLVQQRHLARLPIDRKPLRLTLLARATKFQEDFAE